MTLAPHGCSAEEGCITCGDVALALEVVEVDHERGLALCRDEHDRRETVETALVLPVEAGDTLLVHAGTAIAHYARVANSADVGSPTAAPPRMPGREAEDMRHVSEAEDMRQVSS